MLVTGTALTNFEQFGGGAEPGEDPQGSADVADLAIMQEKVGASEEVSGGEAQEIVTPVAKCVGWKVGDDIRQLTAKGTQPSWSAQRYRACKNEAANQEFPENDYTEEQLARMKIG